MPFIIKVVNNYWEGRLARLLGTEPPTYADKVWLEGYYTNDDKDTSFLKKVSELKLAGIIKITYSNTDADIDAGN